MKLAPYKATSSEYVFMLEPMEGEYVPSKATSSEYVERSMLEPMEGGNGAGYVPFCVGLHWIMTGSGSIRVRLDDATAWASAVAQLRPLLAIGDFEVIGLPGAGGLSEVIPSAAFALIRILPPGTDALAALLLTSPSHIDCACYLGDEHRANQLRRRRQSRIAVKSIVRLPNFRALRLPFAIAS